uniref:ADP,ATP carrier protein n=1 Tax=Alexandrium catenella TaxID=2925 RepID=A0A7S1LHF0_ALECA
MKKAFRSGSAGFVAGTIQVLAFMWLRTAMNFQYKHGGTLSEVLKKLHAEGGVARLYRGLFPWAIFQAPLSRFGDVASNDMVLATMGAVFPSVPVSASTFIGSMAGASWRIVITPVDTCKTVLQTDGSEGWKILKSKLSAGGFTVLWAGWEGNYVANVVGNYPWFFAMNWLQKNVPVPDGALAKLVRSAFIGAVSSSVSDVVSNSIRVVKTKKQTHADASIGYLAATKEIVEKDGLYGVLFRGLETRIMTNVLQGAFFTVLWKYLSGNAR